MQMPQRREPQNKELKLTKRDPIRCALCSLIQCYLDEILTLDNRYLMR